MKKMVVAAAVVLAACVFSTAVGAPVTEDFENGYTDAEPLRVHADWFFEEANNDPTCEDDAGCHWRPASVSSAGVCALQDHDRLERRFMTINSHNVHRSLQTASNGMDTLAGRRWHPRVR